jgi:hypothetical protein
VNLHQVVSGAVSAVNPQMRLVVLVSTGAVTNADGSRVPGYAPPQTVCGDVQALQYSDILQLDALNIEGQRRKIYINGEVDGLVRADNKGGDLVVTPNREVWLVAMVLEYWPDWCSVAVTLQDQDERNLFGTGS